MRTGDINAETLWWNGIHDGDSYSILPRARLKKKVERELLLMQNERLLESLKRKLQKVEGLMKKKNEHIEFLKSCLEEQRESDLQKMMSTDEVEVVPQVEDFSETEKAVRRIMSSEFNYRKMVRLTKQEFDKLVLDVSPSIHQMTFRGIPTKREGTNHHEILIGKYGVHHSLLVCPLSNFELDGAHL